MKRRVRIIPHCVTYCRGKGAGPPGNKHGRKGGGGRWACGKGKELKSTFNVKWFGKDRGNVHKEVS